MLQLPSIHFLFGGHWFEVKPEQYTMQAKGDLCTFCFAPTNDNYWRLGTGFLNQWLVTHSVRDKKMGFAPHIDSWRSKPTKQETLPTRELTSYDGELKVLNRAPSPWFVAIVCVVSGLSFLTTMFFFVWNMMDKCRPSLEKSGNKEPIKLNDW